MAVSNSIKLKRKLKRTVKKQLRNKSFVVVVAVILLCIGVLGYARYMDAKRLAVDPATYQPLLSLIGHAESNDNYNAYFGNPGNTSIKFTDMTIAQVLAWQADHVRTGNASSAVGRYQIVDTTLSGLVHRHVVDSAQKFDRTTQDHLAIALLERRGSVEYVNAKLTREQFAANLAKEWAALPRVIGDHAGDSYYAGDGLNKARVTVDEILQAIAPIQPTQ